MKALALAIIIVFGNLTLPGQYLTKKQTGFSVWSSGYYHRVLYSDNQGWDREGAGLSLGFARELYHDGRILHFGAEIARNCAIAPLQDSLHYMSFLVDSEGDQFTGLFSFDKSRNLQEMLNLSIPVRFGWHFNGGIYFMVGGKIIFNLSGKTTTTSQVTSSAQYAQLIGNNNDGIISQISNHGLALEKRRVSHAIHLMPSFVVSFEAGYMFHKTKYKLLPATNVRLALFIAYSQSSDSFTATTPERTIINTSSTGGYIPVIDAHTHSHSNSNDIFIGIKGTYVFGVKEQMLCIWAPAVPTRE